MVSAKGIAAGYIPEIYTRDADLVVAISRGGLGNPTCSLTMENDS